MFDFIKKSPLGFALFATALVLIVSPEARKSARKFAVRGSAALMNFVDSVSNPQKDPAPSVSPALVNEGGETPSDPGLGS